MTALAIGYDIYAIIFVIILAAVLIVLFGYSRSKHKGEATKEVIDEENASLSNAIENDDDENDENDEDDDREPDVIEIHGCITHKECFSGMNSSVRHPHAYKNFIINFRSDDGKDFEYSIDEETYLSIEEGDSGYVAIVGERFYGYCSDKDAANEIE